VSDIPALLLGLDSKGLAEGVRYLEINCAKSTRNIFAEIKRPRIVLSLLLLRARASAIQMDCAENVKGLIRELIDEWWGMNAQAFFRAMRSDDMSDLKDGLAEAMDCTPEELDAPVPDLLTRVLQAL